MDKILLWRRDTNTRRHKRIILAFTDEQLVKPEARDDMEFMSKRQIAKKEQLSLNVKATKTTYMNVGKLNDSLTLEHGNTSTSTQI